MFNGDMTNDPCYMVTFCWFCDQAIQFSSALGDVLQILHDAAMAESQEPVEQPTRWLIKPKERVRLLLKFFSEDSGCSGGSSRQAGSLKMHI